MVFCKDYRMKLKYIHNSRLSAIVIILFSIILYFSLQGIFNSREVPLAEGCKVASKVSGEGKVSSINGLTFVADEAKEGKFSFEIKDKRGKDLDHFTLTHQRAVHIFFISDDYHFYYHLHPKFKDGSWSIELPLMVRSNYNVYVDFEYKGVNFILKEEAGTLGSGLVEDWNQFPNYTLATSGEYTTKAHNMVLLSALELGEPIVLDEFLGVVGHIVGINLNNGEYVHFHSVSLGAMAQCPGYLVPIEDKFIEDDLKAGYIHLMSNFKESGQYRLFVQFMHQGRVVTKEFTVEVKAS